MGFFNISPGMSYIVLKTYSNYIEANIALSMLEQEGINCHLEDEHTVTMISLASGIRLMVYASQAERAAEVLVNVETEYLKTVRCPNCDHSGFEIKYVTESHESEMRKLPFGRFFVFLSKLSSKEGPTIQVKHYICLNCKKEFDDLPS